MTPLGPVCDKCDPPSDQCSTSLNTYGEHLKSFPSGHSSMSAAGLGFLTFYLLGQLGAYSSGGFAWRAVLALMPTLIAVAIGITRVTDYWHHPSDVATGLVLGFGVSFVIYRQMFPCFTHPQSHTPIIDLLPLPKGTAVINDEDCRELLGTAEGQGLN